MAFEIARRHRFVGDLAALPDGVDVHVLPTGQQRPAALHATSRSSATATPRTCASGSPRAHEASARYLDEHGLGPR